MTIHRVENAGGAVILSATVWPAYLGLASGDPGPGPAPDHEPFDDFDYQRGQIHWRTEPDGIFGRALVLAPKGIYTWFVFCNGPIKEMMINAKPIPGTPIVFDRAGIVEVNPIQNIDYLPRRG